MSRNGSGVYTLPVGNPVVSGTPIASSWANTTLTDIGNELTNSIDKSGRTTPLADLPLGGFKLTGMGSGSISGDSVPYQQVLNQDHSAIAAAATVDLAGATATDIEVTGTGATITSFGTGALAGVAKWLTFSGATNTLTNSATLICQGGTNLVMTAGDVCKVTSQGTNVWRVSQVARGLAITARLSDLGSAAAANTLANAAYSQVWGWTITSGLTAFTFTDASAAVASSTLVQIAQTGANTSLKLLGVATTSYNGELLAVYGGGQITIGALTRLTAGNGATVTIGGNSAGAGSNGSGGDMIITAGAKDGSGTQGLTRISGANGTSAIAELRFTGLLAAFLGTGPLFIATRRLILNAGTVPTLGGTGGAGAVIAGSDLAFEVIAGTGSPTSFTATFAVPRTVAPQICLPATSQAGCRLNYTVTTTTVQISTDLAWSSGAKISVLLIELA